jgi:transcriptional regulator with XRE-family HTH domain
VPGTPQSKDLRRRRAELQQAVGAKVRELRERGPNGKSGWTQQALANRVQDLLGEEGSSLTYQKVVSKVENGTQPITLEVVDVLARALDVDPIVLLESAFHFAPRNAEEIASQRIADFQRRVEAAIDVICKKVEGNAESELGRRAASAISQLAVESPSDLPGAVGMLEGLLIYRGYEAAQSQSASGLAAAKHNVLKAQTPTELTYMFAEMAPDELTAMLSGFFFQLSATLRFAARKRAVDEGAGL